MTGLNRLFKQREKGLYLKKHEISLAGFIDAKDKEPKFKSSLNKVDKGWK